MRLNTGYFVGNMIIFIPWLWIFIRRRDLHKEMIVGGLLSLPLVLTAPLFIPEYWNPPYLFGLLPYLNIGIEDVMFAFFPGSLATVVFEYVEKKKLIRYTKKRHSVLHFTPYFLAGLTFLLLEIFYSKYSIYNLLIGCVVGMVYMLYKRRDLAVQMFTSGFLFMFLYLLMFTLFNYFLYPNYIENVYNQNNLINFRLLKLPLEEYVFAFFVGAAWSGIYEFIFGYKTR